jgi:hypothetical protein
VDAPWIDILASELTTCAEHALGLHGPAAQQPGQLLPFLEH